MTLIYYFIVGLCYGLTQLVTGDYYGKESARKSGEEYHTNLRYRLGELTAYTLLWPLFVISDIMHW